MKTLKILGLVAAQVALAGMAQATLVNTYTYTGSGYDIGDNNPVGVVSTLTVGGDPGQVVSGGVTVGLNITGGFNSDLYGYLISPTGTRVVLLNLAPNNQAGMEIYLGSTGTTIGSSLTPDATYLPTGDGAGNLATGFDGVQSYGTWTLFLADLSPGGTSHLVGWGFDAVSVVPEPVGIALGVFAAALVGLGGLTLWRNRRKAA